MHDKNLTQYSISPIQNQAKTRMKTRNPEMVSDFFYFETHE